VVALPSRSAPPAVGSGDLVADAAGGPGDQDAVAGLEVGGVDRGDGGDPVSPSAAPWMKSIDSGSAARPTAAVHQPVPQM
jgi:hypothetical protein